MPDIRAPMIASPYGALAERLRPMLREDAKITGTPMAPIHHNTLDDIVHWLEQAHFAAAEPKQ